jgi:hypothetical protein
VDSLGIVINKSHRSDQSKNPKIGSVELKVSWLQLLQFLGCDCAARIPDGAVTNESSKTTLYVFWNLYTYFASTLSTTRADEG